MSRSLNTFINNIRTKSRDPNLDASTIATYLNGAILEMKSDYRIPSAIRRETLRIFPGVNEYPMPIPTGLTETDFESIVDLTDWFEGAENSSRFDRVGIGDFARKNVRGWHDNYITPFVRNLQNMLLVDYTPPNANSLAVNECDDLTTNGTWTASGDANNLTADDVTYLSGAGSLNFDITPSSLTAILTNTGMSALDLSDYVNNSNLFAYVYLPVATNITQFALRWGNDASNYYSVSITTQHNGLAFQNGWNLISFDWNNATETGSVDDTTIDYLQFRMTFNSSQAADTDFRLDKIFIAQGTDCYFHYNSKYWVKSSAGVIQETFSGSTTTDLFIGTEAEAEALETKALKNIFELEIIDDLKSAQQEKRYQTLLRNLKAQNPQEEKGRSVQYAKKGIF